MVLGDIGPNIAEVIVGITALTGVVLTGFWARGARTASRNASASAERAVFETTQNGGGSTMDTLFRTIRSEFDRVSSRLDQLERRIDERIASADRRLAGHSDKLGALDRELDAFRDQVIAAMTMHTQQHEKQAEIDRLGRNGRLERRER
jgi:hypothetical protein